MANVHTLTYRPGDPFSETFEVQDDAGAPVDLGGFTGRAEVRYVAGGTLIESFVVTVAQTTPAEDPEPANDAGFVTVALTGVETAALEELRDRDGFRYDVILTDGDGNDDPTPIAEGAFVPGLLITEATA